MHVAVGDLRGRTRVSEVHGRRFEFTLGVSTLDEHREFARGRVTQEFKFLKSKCCYF